MSAVGGGWHLWVGRVDLVAVVVRCALDIRMAPVGIFDQRSLLV